MIEIRSAASRGHAQHGWLDSRHSFSFADYYDPAHLQFGALRVLNDDRVAPGAGFGMHGHRDMEIVSYVLDGALEHRDSLGNGSVIRAGDVQRMTAGTGVLHSEYNPQADAPTHFLQIWILPRRAGATPGYAQRHFSAADKRGRFCLLVSPDGEEGALTIDQDARLYAGLFDAGETLAMPLDRERLFYLHLARGSVDANGIALRAGDALKLHDESALTITNGSGAELLLFDLAR